MGFIARDTNKKFPATSMLQKIGARFRYDDGDLFAYRIVKIHVARQAARNPAGFRSLTLFFYAIRIDSAIIPSIGEWKPWYRPRESNRFRTHAKVVLLRPDRVPSRGLT